MALETVTHISDLVVTNPTSTDPKSEGDNHLRNIKTALKTDFPNISGVVTKTHTQLNNALDKTGDTMTGNLAVPLGAVALPSYTFSGDTNTGMWSPGADILAWSTGGAERLRIDTSGNVLVTGSGGLGYGVGSGGTVTQATSKTTAVTLNKPSGLITTNNAALGAGARAVFQFSNSLIGTADALAVSIGGGAPAATSYRCWVGYTSAGQAFIGIENLTAGSLSEAVEINFAVIKGARS